MFALLIAGACIIIPAFLSIAVWNRGNVGDSIFLGFMGLLVSLLVNMMVGGIATAINNEEKITKWKISDVNQYTTDDGVRYSYRYKDHMVDNFGSGSDEIRYTDGEPYRMKNCGVPVGGLFPMNDCSQYIYITEE